MNELALFAGAGGGILGGHLLGWRCVCAVELEDYPRRVLLARQRDGMLPRFPIWDDVTTFDGHPWRGRVDVISGGFPCQDISAAGKGAGITGDRSGLWSHMARVIGEVRPRFVFVENSPLLISRGLDVVLDSLAALGYDAAWGIVGAHHAGAPHKRDRIWIVADSKGPCGQQQADEANTGAVGGEGWNGSVCGYSHVADADGCLCDGRTDQPERGPQGRVAAGGCGEAMANTSGAGCEGRKQPRTLRNNRGGAQTHGPVSECGCSPGPEVSDTQSGGFAVCRGASGQGRHALRDCVPAEGNEELADSDRALCDGCEGDFTGGVGTDYRGGWWESEPDLGGMVDGMAPGLDIHGAATAGDVGRVATGVPNRAGRLKSIGNGQVPAVAALAWRILSNDNQ